MENTSQISNNCTILKDRILIYDGDSIVEPSKIIDMILDGSKLESIYSTEITDEIKKYNETAIDKIEVKTELKEFDLTWDIPEEYKTINILEYTLSKYVNSTEFGDTMAYKRITDEIKIFKKEGMYDFIRTLIYVQDTIEKNNIIKGVGRGSSVSSYVLYLIGIHNINSYKYNLDFSEFIKI